MKHYSVTDGLLSPKVFKIVKDNDGFLWFCTSNGVSQFNGFDFTNYNISNGFQGDGAFDAEVDSKGRIWFITFNDQVLFYKDHTFHPFKTPYYISWIFFNHHGEMSLITTNGHLLQYRNDVLFSDIAICPDKLGYGYYLSENKIIVHSNLSGQSYIINNGIVRKGQSIYSFGLHYSFLRVFSLNDGKLVAGCSNKLFEISNDSLIPIVAKNNPIKGDIMYIYDDGNEVWIGADDGLFKCKRSSLGQNIELVSRKGPTTSIIKDDCDNYWFSTLKDGFYTFHDKKFSNIFFPLEPDDEIVSISGYDKKSIFVFYRNGNIKRVIFEKGGIRLEKVIELGTTIYQVARDFNKGFIIRISKENLVFNGKNIKPFSIREGYMFYEGCDSTVYFYNDQLFQLRMHNNKFYKDTLRDKSAKSTIRDRAIRVFAAKKDTIWGGNEGGIVRYAMGKIIKPFSDHIANSYIADIKIDRAGIIWVATKSMGVYYIKDNILHTLGKQEGLPVSGCNSLFVDVDDNVWLACEGGVYKIIKKDGHIAIRSYNYRSILPRTSVKGVFKYDKYLFVQTNLGLNIMDEGKVPENVPPPKVFITNLSVDNHDTIPVNNFILNYYHNNIRFDFTSIDQISLKKPFYYYCLSGKDSIWVYTSQSSINFSYLQPGAYTFYAIAENMDGKRSDKIASIHFTIVPPFWRTWWFYISSFLLLCFFIIIIVRHYKSIALKKRMLVETELKALRLHMNPHFIFNTLNSLQSFVFNGQPEEANNYIAKLSKMIRWIMNYSDKTELTLEEELLFLSTYLELECMRFKKEFELDIKIDPALETSTIIPALVIQPFVENAIKHGLSGKKGKCLLQISLTKMDKYIQVIIQDNGVGRNKAMALQAASPIVYKSTGIHYTAERLGILTGRKKTKDLVTVTDLFENGEASGTRVELHLPILR